MITRKRALEIASLKKKSWQLQHEIEFAETTAVPKIIFHESAEQYFNHVDGKYGSINIGLFGPIEYFKVKSDGEYISAINYFRQHESEHRHSTAGEPWKWCISRGIQVILEYISAQVEPSKRRFRNDSDYEYFVNTILPKYGVCINMSTLANFSHAVANSLEDGRIERGRSESNPGFKKLVQQFRGIYWEKCNQEFIPYDELKKDPVTFLHVLMNQILFLSTMQLYQKGFVLAYGDTEMMSIIRGFMPCISKGIISGTTRGMGMQSVEICRMLAPYVYEASRCDISEMAEQLKQLLEKMIRNVIKETLGKTDDFSDGGISEADEKRYDESLSSVFPASDLEITLDDETFDKLKENGKLHGKGQIKVNRQHPIEETEPEKEQESNNELSNVQQPETKNGTEQLCDALPDPCKSQSTMNSAESTEDDDFCENAAVPSKVELNNEKKNSSSREKGPVTPAKADNETLEAVHKAMEEAAGMTREEAEASLMNTSEAVTAANRAKVRSCPDTDEPLTTEYVKDICNAFIEVKRSYKLTDNLPPDIQARGRSMRRKNEKYFQSLSSPNVTCLNSGSVDPSRIFGLAIGESNIFRKLGKDSVFDGCVYMLVDNSGSMSCGVKRQEACKAAAVIEESFSGLIPLKIVAFDECVSIIHEVIKGWDEIPKKNGCWNFFLHGRYGSGNEDNYDIRIATKELLSRPERKKMLVILSDGAPGNTEAVKIAVDDARKAGIKVASIYFEEGSVTGHAAEVFEYMYSKDFVCCELSKVDENLSKIFKRFSRT